VGELSSKGERCDVEIPVCRVVRQPDEAFSTHTTLQKCGLTFQISYRQRGAVRTRARQIYSRRLREVEIARRVPDTVGSRIQPGVYARYDRHCGEAFSLLAQPLSQLDKVPYRPLLVSTMANQNERPLLTLAPKGPAADVTRMIR
jgi:hypothetical protein